MQGKIPQKSNRKLRNFFVCIDKSKYLISTITWLYSSCVILATVSTKCLVTWSRNSVLSYVTFPIRIWRILDWIQRKQIHKKSNSHFRNLHMNYLTSNDIKIFLMLVGHSKINYGLEFLVAACFMAGYQEALGSLEWFLKLLTLCQSFFYNVGYRSRKAMAFVAIRLEGIALCE